ncbi:hypothetical protein HQ590_04795 [bacterium]|nr:hypothetical protein [bacterium]
MILVNDEIVWVEQADGRRVAFSAPRLANCIRRATDCWAEAGDDLAEWIAAAISDYGRRHAPQRTLTAAGIAEMVEAVLALLGFEDWAAAYRGRRGATVIHLDQLAGPAGDGFELAFYRDLDRALAAVLRQAADRVRLRGLRACVLRLRGRRRWGRRCRHLADEIVHHVYARAAAWRPGRPRSLRMAIEE